MLISDHHIGPKGGPHWRDNWATLVDVIALLLVTLGMFLYHRSGGILVIFNCGVWGVTIVGYGPLSAVCIK